jgi:hypothetical protein
MCLTLLSTAKPLMDGVADLPRIGLAKVYIYMINERPAFLFPDSNHKLCSGKQSIIQPTPAVYGLQFSTPVFIHTLYRTPVVPSTTCFRTYLYPHSQHTTSNTLSHAVDMVKYAFIAFAGLTAALPLNINLGAYSPALVVGTSPPSTTLPPNPRPLTPPRVMARSASAVRKTSPT